MALTRIIITGYRECLKCQSRTWWPGPCECKRPRSTSRRLIGAMWLLHMYNSQEVRLTWPLGGSYFRFDGETLVETPAARAASYEGSAAVFCGVRTTR